MKLTPEIAQALANLRGNKDFAAVLDGVSEHVNEETTRCTKADGPTLYRAQGAVEALAWWVDSFANAPGALDKFKKQPQK